jgi:hypothetical protein
LRTFCLIRWCFRHAIVAWEEEEADRQTWRCLHERPVCMTSLTRLFTAVTSSLLLLYSSVLVSLTWIVQLFPVPNHPESVNCLCLIFPLLSFCWHYLSWYSKRRNRSPCVTISPPASAVSCFRFPPHFHSCRSPHANDVTDRKR